MHKVTRARIYIVMFCLFLFCQTVLHKTSIFGLMPDLIIVYVIFFGLFYGMRLGVEVGVVAGFFQDILGVNIFGMNIFFLGITGLITGSISDKVYRENYVGQSLITFVVCFLLSKFNIVASIYTAVLAPCIFYLLEKIFRIENVFDNMGNRI